MPDRNYLVRFKEPTLVPQLVRAATIEIQADHLVFSLSGGILSALFLLEVVEDWEELDG
jgi:hypothetical protein